jgi:hypothetical protein
VARARVKTSTSSATSSGMFARSAFEWQALSAPSFMVSDAAAVAAFDRWCPTAGDTRLRFALTGHLPTDPAKIAAMKVRWLRSYAAPRLLWMAGALAPDEAAQIARWALWRRGGNRSMTLSAPDWLRSAPPWESAE